MEKVIEVLNKYKIQIISILIVILLIPIIKITINKIKQNYSIETVEKEKYFVLLSNNLTGVIDEKGTIIMEPKYYNICIPNPSKAIFVCYYNYDETTGKCKTKVVNAQETELFTTYHHIDVIELNGIETTIPYEKNLLKYQENGKYGLLDLEGKKITEAIYEELNGLSGKEGELLVKVDGKYGVINNKGVSLIKPKYDYIAGDEYYTSQKNKNVSGYITGEKTENGYRYGYITAQKKVLLTPEYNELTRVGGIEEEDTDRNVFLIARKNGQYGFIKNKKVVIDFKYQEIYYSGVKNLFIVTRNKKSGICTTKGKVILEAKYDEITVEDDSIITVSQQQEEYFHLNGKSITYKEPSENVNQEEEKTENAGAKLVTSSLIPDEKDGKWGFVDKNKKVVVDHQYEEVTDFNKYGFAGIKKNGKWGSINEKGKVVQEPIYHLDELDEISFIGKYYKVVYDYKTIYYTDDVNNE